MADEMDKNHDATPFKLMEARRKGQVAKSMELVSFFSLLAMLAVMVSSLEESTGFIASKTAWWLESAYESARESSHLWQNLVAYISELAHVLLSIVVAGIIAAIVATIVHVGPMFSGFPLKPDFSRINPAQGFKKIFSLKSLFDLLRLVLKVIVFCWVFYLVIDHKKADLFSPNHAGMDYLLVNLQDTILLMIYAALGVFLVFAVIDTWYTRKHFSRQMRMSMRDIKDEVKRHDGDPQIKAKRKRVLSELLKNAANIRNVKEADVVITNPTHVAVALKYRPDSMAVPIVIAKGQGLIAKSIKYQARKYSVPVIRKPALARALLKQVGVNNPIPAELQLGVAGVYRWVISMSRHRVFDK